jgi:hypothetical protein
MSGGSPPDRATPALGGPGFLADGAVAVTRRRTVSAYALAHISIQAGKQKRFVPKWNLCGCD